MKIEKDRDALRTELRSVQYARSYALCVARSLVNHGRPTVVQSNVSKEKIGFKPGNKNETSFESDDEFIVPVGRPSLIGLTGTAGTAAAACI